MPTLYQSKSGVEPNNIKSSTPDFDFLLPNSLGKTGIVNCKTFITFGYGPPMINLDSVGILFYFYKLSLLVLHVEKQVGSNFKINRENVINNTALFFCSVNFT